MATLTEATRRRGEIFKETCGRLNLAPRDLGYLFGLGDREEEKNLRRKLRDIDATSYRAPTKADNLAVQLLQFLQTKGYDLEGITFDEDGRLTNLPKQKKSK